MVSVSARCLKSSTGFEQLVSRRIRKDYLENYVLGVVEQNMFSRDKLPELAGKLVMLVRDKGWQNAQDEKAFYNELADVEKKIGNIVKAIEDGPNTTF